MTEQINDEPAFPLTDEAGLICEGLSIRDYFAAKAMQAILSRNTNLDLTSNETEIAVTAAYYIANAMLKEREK
jgi:hypothetical protein